MRARALMLALVLFLLYPALSLAHPGGTDAHGGHYDRSTGEYHYHHGYPSHQHVNGVCPYDFDDKTGTRSGTPSSSSSTAPPDSAWVNYIAASTYHLSLLCPNLTADSPVSIPIETARHLYHPCSLCASSDKSPSPTPTASSAFFLATASPPPSPPGIYLSPPLFFVLCPLLVALGFLIQHLFSRRDNR